MTVYSLGIKNFSCSNTSTRIFNKKMLISVKLEFALLVKYIEIKI